jgi:hypothetical protein
MGNSIAVDLHEQAMHSWLTKRYLKHPWNASHNRTAGHAMEATEVHQSIMPWEVIEPLLGASCFLRKSNLCFLGRQRQQHPQWGTELQQSRQSAL